MSNFFFFFCKYGHKKQTTSTIIYTLNGFIIKYSITIRKHTIRKILRKKEMGIQKIEQIEYKIRL